MSKAESPPVTSLVLEEARRLNRPVDQQTAEGIARYFRLLARWASHMRVTGTSDARELLARHLADSLVLLDALPPSSVLRCIDVGAGGGLPGIPVALMRPAVQLTLVDANRRKCALLRTAVDHLGCRCVVLNQRIETLQLAASPSPGAGDGVMPFDVAWSLAAFAVPAWLTEGARLVRPDGLVVLFCSQLPEQPCHDELQIEDVTRYELASGRPRAMVLYRRL